VCEGESLVCWESLNWAFRGHCNLVEWGLGFTNFVFIVRFTLSFSLSCVSHSLFCLIVRFTLCLSSLCVWRFLFPHWAFGAFFFPIVRLALSFSSLCVWRLRESVIFCFGLRSFLLLFSPFYCCSLVGCFFFILFIYSIKKI